VKAASTGHPDETYLKGLIYMNIEVSVMEKIIYDIERELNGEIIEALRSIRGRR